MGSTEAWPGLTVNLTGRDVAACYVTTPHSGIFSPTALPTACPGFHKPRQNEPWKRDPAGKTWDETQKIISHRRSYLAAFMTFFVKKCFCVETEFGISLNKPHLKPTNVIFINFIGQQDCMKFNADIFYTAN